MTGKLRLFPISATKSGKWITPWGHEFNTEKEPKAFLRGARLTGKTP